MKHVKEMRKFATREGISRPELDLWLYLYTEMAELGQWDEVALETPMLMQELQMCRSVFYRTRAGLVSYGLLKMQRRGHRIYYSLNLNWDTVAETEALTDEQLPGSIAGAEVLVDEQLPENSGTQATTEANTGDTAVCRKPGESTSLASVEPDALMEHIVDQSLQDNWKWFYPLAPT